MTSIYYVCTNGSEAIALEKRKTKMALILVAYLDAEKYA